MTNEKRIQLIQLCILSAMEFARYLNDGLELRQDSMHLFVAWHTLHTNNIQFDDFDYQHFSHALGHLVLSGIVEGYEDGDFGVSYRLRANQKTRDNYRISLLS